MEVIKFSFDKEYKLPKLVIALGQFDGIHLAHLKIINKVINEAKKSNNKSAIITFYPHPDFVLGKRKEEGYLTPLEDKIEFFRNLQLDYLIILNFTKEMGNMEPKDFEEKVLAKFKIEKIIIGFDYHYGKFGKGNVNTLKKLYKVSVIKKVLFENEKMGSTQVRKYLLEGNTLKVKEILGRYYNIFGVVQPGSKIGTALGYKTANIFINNSYYDLMHGVYAVFVEVDNKKYFGVGNVGYNPTVNTQDKPRIEVHILNFDESLYGKTISIDFVYHIRPEIKFSSKLELQSQIKEDIIIAKRILDKEA
ncbi:MAG: riboflavin biosynthesis protein RibF [Bacilli bacterium]|jgi:riboflavin kinase/FMN adenylyltransferase|nr:riboflavin biosynthesis protein RibF [Bacilli bacterium]